ncbi:FRG domain-containing protein [Xylanibacter oryzae]|uniref:FRG domain-containing protein n=1 Tax=Xylanibacter oryzae TaxID=185293 RepID=UPI0004ADF5A0|nr:FRG domain-containing protein [Xylanibacter oryzae]
MEKCNVKEIKCSSVEDFIKKMSYNGELYKLITDQFIFRGESSDQHKLIPSALRKDNHEHLVDLVKESWPEFTIDNNNSEYFQIIAEYISLHQFYADSDYRGLYVPEIKDFRNKIIGNVDIIEILKQYYSWIPSEYIDIAGLAQHYGVYTRLLDWSRDINVAIYFALSGLVTFEENPVYPENILLWALNTSIYDAVDKERPGLRLCTPQYAGNPNLCAQKGIFTLNQVECYFYYLESESLELNQKFINNDMIVKPFDDFIKEQKPMENGEPILYRISIPTPKDDELYKYLSNKGYDASLIFPGYNGITKKITETIYWNNQKLKNEQKTIEE